MALHTDQGHPHVHVVVKAGERAWQPSQYLQVDVARVASRFRAVLARVRGAGKCDRACGSGIAPSQSQTRNLPIRSPRPLKSSAGSGGIRRARVAPGRAPTRRRQVTAIADSECCSGGVAWFRRSGSPRRNARPRRPNKGFRGSHAAPTVPVVAASCFRAARVERGHRSPWLMVLGFSSEGNAGFCPSAGLTGEWPMTTDANGRNQLDGDFSQRRRVTSLVRPSSHHRNACW
jgi:hypothetical protein